MSSIWFIRRCGVFSPLSRKESPFALKMNPRTLFNSHDVVFSWAVTLNLMGWLACQSCEPWSSPSAMYNRMVKLGIYTVTLASSSLFIHESYRLCLRAFAGLFAAALPFTWLGNSPDPEEVIGTVISVAWSAFVISHFTNPQKLWVRKPFLRVQNRVYLDTCIALCYSAFVVPMSALLCGSYVNRIPLVEWGILLTSFAMIPVSTYPGHANQA